MGAMVFDFTGRTLLLTGANGGIGRAIAQSFHAAGANVLLCDLEEADTRALAASIDSGLGRLAVIAMDASRAEAARAAVELCLDRFGGLDFLIPAAAIYEEQPFDALTDEQWRRTMSVNLDGVFYICRHAVLVMGGGSIVLIASEAGYRGATPVTPNTGRRRARCSGWPARWHGSLRPAFE